MIKNFITTYLLLLFVFLFQFSSCAPSSGNKTNGRGSSGRGFATGTTTPSTQNSTGTTSTSGVIQWSSQNVLSLDILVNSNISTPVYLRGSGVQQFLNTTTIPSASYCLLMRFNIATPGAKTQLRIRAVPMTLSNQEKILRLDLTPGATNQSFCQGTLETVTTALAAFSPSEVCPNCLNTVNSISLNLFTSTGTSINTTAVASFGVGSIQLTQLIFRINPENNSSTPIPQCTNNSCVVQGYDCCIPSTGQCVHDGEVRPGSLSDPAFSTIQSMVALNPSTFQNYPQYYYVCGGAQTSTPPDSGSVDPVAVAQAQLTTLINDYKCIKELELYSSSTPWQHGPLNAGHTYTSCNTASLSNTLYYTNVMNRMYAMCGCSVDPSELPPNDPAHLCPLYSLVGLDQNQQVTTNLTLIRNVQCLTPAVTPTPGPFQSINVGISTRTVPLIFSEGTTFSYQDPGTYLLPQNVAFNMNAIMGNLNTDLSEAIPAKSITIENDESYIVMVNSAYHRPCPMCGPDQWNNSLSSFPQTQNGMGVQGITYSTNRESLDGNPVGANYEDLKFGRACYIPPTMIPFSHKAATPVATQRQNRLKTQAALFMNGYQRDWFGFNYGALIGSFDGVSWFAIGKSRRVHSTSTKLYLAINAPFGDLAQLGTYSINIIKDNLNTNAADYDYDFELSPTNLKQNFGASCQRWHLCATDSDCITKLGWEYMCADVGGVRTQWPSFNSSGDEVVSAALTRNMVQILAGQTVNSDDMKRCVYRGAGALCNTRYNLRGNGVSQSDLNARKLTTCAPNFTCKSLSSAAFNDSIARFGAPVDSLPLSLNHLLGSDANVLGRPLNYIGTTSLNSDVITNLKAQVSLNPNWDYTNYEGMCVPGKKIDTVKLTNSSTNVATQYNSRDTTLRTDAINQIAACVSTDTHSNTLTTKTRLLGCPIIETDTANLQVGNYHHITDATDYVSADLKNLLTQNSCGAEAQTSGGVSAFDDIEAPILSSAVISQKTLMGDACLRRAGSVCFSDLDCGPNHLHSDIADSLSTSSFGNTLAEQKYWQESLVCGQAQPKPNFSAGSTAFYNYDITKNKCCREIGNTISLYTQGDPDSDSTSLVTSLLSATSPNSNYRYSRYSVVPDLSTTTFVAGSTTVATYYPAPNIQITNSGATNALLNFPYQWKTIAKTAAMTCCGGGWVRKFADDTHTWPIANRLSLDVSNFQCLNYPNKDVAELPSGVAQATYDLEFDYFCTGFDNKNANCAQVPYATTTGYSEVVPTAYDTTTEHRILTHPDSLIMESSNGSFTEMYPWFAPYRPLLVPDASAIGTTTVAIGTSYFPADPSPSYSSTRSVRLRLPTYIRAVTNISKIEIYDVSQSSFTSLTTCYNPTTADCSSSVSALNLTLDGGIYLEIILPTGSTYINQSDDIGIAITYTNAIGLNSPTPTYYQPGNDLYYLKKLAKFELTGIPQVALEPIYCNWDKDALVPELFDVSADTRSAFQTDSDVFSDASNKITSASDPLNSSFKLAANTLTKPEPVFSNQEMVCCLKNNETTTDETRCCSGYAKTVNGKLTCKLPTGTDLHVYFNRFITSEGSSDDDVVQLLDADFDPYTGEPKMQAQTMNKIYSLGVNLCANGTVKQGGAFGSFKGEPIPTNGVYAGNTKTLYSIVDSVNDLDKTNTQQGERGYLKFQQGFRWNHHLYCD